MFLEIIFFAWFLPLVALPLAITCFLVYKSKNIIVKIILGILIPSVSYSLIFADEYNGREKFSELCETQSGAHIYKTIELGPEYWSEEGNPTFIYPKGHRKNGDITDELLELGYSKERIQNDNFVSGLNISELTIRIVEKSSNTTLGEFKRYGYKGGWVNNITGYHVTGKYCPQFMYLSKNLYPKIFVKRAD